MAGIEAFAASLLLPGAPEAEGDEPAAHVSFFEIAGSRCVDLLAPGSRGRELTLKQDADGRVQLLGATSASLDSAEALRAALAYGKSRRATHATGANACSSRSHAVCQVIRHCCYPRESFVDSNGQPS